MTRKELLDQLSANCVQVTLTVRKWNGEKLDKLLTSELETQKNSEQGWSKVTKNLASKDDLQAFQKIKDAAFGIHYRDTMPWTDGSQIIAKNKIIEYNKQMELFQAEFFMARENLLYNYDKLKAVAKAASGDLYDEALYPSEDELREKFAFHWRYAPLPNSAAIVQMAAIVGDAVALETEEHLTGMATNTLRHIAIEAQEMMQSVKAGLDAGQVGGRTVAAAKRMGQRILDLNWSANPEISAIGLAMMNMENAKDINGNEGLIQATKNHIASVIGDAEVLLNTNKEYRIEF